MEVKMEIQSPFKEKVEKIKNHIKENKEKYIIGVVSVGSALCAAYVAYGVGNRRGFEEGLDWGQELGNVFPTWTISKSQIRNSSFVQKTISIYGNDIGRPGNEVVDTTDWKKYGSQHLAAQAMGVSDTLMSKHMNGERDHINNRVFKHLIDLHPPENG
jgi:hypothetical protein